jgi:ADP-ribose pyrophosphatase YjhB (NUDIX family)
MGHSEPFGSAQGKLREESVASQGATMKLRVRAAVIISGPQGLLLVKHRHPETGREWWVPPGGGVNVGEALAECAEREAFEETGLRVTVGSMLYLREFIDDAMGWHNIEVFFLAHSFDGEPTIRHVIPGDPDAEYIKEARWLTQGEMGRLTVFPEELKDEFWAARVEGRLTFRYLGQQHGRSDRDEPNVRLPH